MKQPQTGAHFHVSNVALKLKLTVLEIDSLESNLGYIPYSH